MISRKTIGHGILELLLTMLPACTRLLSLHSLLIYPQDERYVCGGGEEKQKLRGDLM